MTTKIYHILFFALTFSFILSVCAQKPINKKWDAEKIKGVRFLPYPSFNGFPFLNDTWVPGKIEFSDGEIADSLFLRYSSFKDELVYYNKAITTQIVIDKASLKGFTFTDTDGAVRVFRKLYFDGFNKGDRFLEVLSGGETDLLAFRKVSMIGTSPYKDRNGILKNTNYEPTYQFYFYSPEKGFTSVRPNWISLLAKFDKLSQKPIRKLLRKNRIKITNERNFIHAWQVIEKEGFKVMF